MNTLGILNKVRHLRSLLFQGSLRRRVALSFGGASSIFVLIVVSISGAVITNDVRDDRRARVEQRIESLRSTIDSSRFLASESQRSAIQPVLDAFSKGSSDVYIVHLAGGEVLLPPNWYLIPQDRLRLQLLGQAANDQPGLTAGTYGDRFELTQYGSQDQKSFIDVYRNITLEDRLVFGYVVQGAVFTLVAIGVFLYIGFLLGSGIVKPVLVLDEVVSGLSPENLQASLEDMSEAPVELRHLASSTAGMARRLEHAWDNQRMFVSAVSHEFRNSMTVICGYLERVQRDLQVMTPRHRKSIKEIAYESQRLVKMFDQLLQISRVDMGRQDVKLRPVDVILFVREIVAVRGALSDRAIQFSIDSNSISKGELYINVDETNLEQVVVNLLENAFKYSSPSSLVRVCLSCRGERAIISVSDQGIGIPEADQARIFERFYRASNAAAYADGTGLGLPLDKLLMQRMNGDIQLASSGAEGSTFEILLPLPS